MPYQRHTIEVGEPPFDEWVQAEHIPDGSTRSGLRTMYANYAQYGFPGGNALVLSCILGRKPRTLQQYIQELASRFAAA